MARTKRGFGGRSGRSQPLNELQSALGSLLRSTLQQVGVVTDAALRQAQTSRVRFDEVMHQRKRRDAMARLGEAVHELWAQGRLGDLEQFPEVADLIADIDELEDAPDEGGPEPEPGYDAVSSSDWQPPRKPAGEAQVWRPVMPSPVMPSDDSDIDGNTGGDADGDNASAAARGVDDPGDLAAGRVEPAAPSARVSRRRSARAARLGQSGPGHERGGIAFVRDEPADPDEDLAEYMHEDDVPAGGGD